MPSLLVMLGISPTRELHTHVDVVYSKHSCSGKCLYPPAEDQLHAATTQSHVTVRTLPGIGATMLINID